MTSKDLLNYLIKKYGYEKPILLKDIYFDGISEAAIKVMIKRMLENGKLKKQAWGVYFVPKENKYRIASTCSIDLIIKEKFISDGKNVYGYFGETSLLNRVGISNQVPNVQTVFTNNEKTIKRVVKIQKFKVILKKPYCHITKSNVKYLELLELLRSLYDEEELKVNKKTIKEYINIKNINLKEAQKYLEYFPSKVTKRFNILEE